MRSRTVAGAQSPHRARPGEAIASPNAEGGVKERAAVFIGIDVSKAYLDVAVHGEAGVRRVGNEEKEIQGLVLELVGRAPELVVMEATGGYEMPVAAALAAAGVPVVIANPRQTRDFARSTGQLSKTDAIDARGLALFAARVRPSVRELPSEEAQALDAVVARRRQIIGMLTQEKNRLGFALAPVQKGIRRHISWLERQWAQVDGISMSGSGRARCGPRRAICCSRCRAWARTSPAR